MYTVRDIGLVWIFYTQKSSFPRIICKIIFFSSFVFFVSFVKKKLLHGYSLSLSLSLSYTHTHTHTQWERERERERQTDRQTDRQRQRETDRQKGREREFIYTLEIIWISLCIYGGQRTALWVGSLLNLLSGFWKLNFGLFYFIGPNVEFCGSTKLFFLLWFCNIILDQMFWLFLAS
jgi:hypothetical protein